MTDVGNDSEYVEVEVAVVDGKILVEVEVMTDEPPAVLHADVAVLVQEFEQLMLVMKL